MAGSMPAEWCFLVTNGLPCDTSVFCSHSLLVVGSPIMTNDLYSNLARVASAQHYGVKLVARTIFATQWFTSF